MFLEKYITNVDNGSFDEYNNTLLNELKKSPEDQKLLDEIIRINIPIVFSVASSLGASKNNKMYEHDDVVAEGIIALYRAITRYNDKKGKFSTYAFKCVKLHLIGKLNKHIVWSPQLIKIPNEKYLRIREALKNLNAGKEITEEEKELISYSFKYISDNIDPNGFNPEKDVYFDVNRYISEQKDNERLQYQKDWVEILKPLLKKLSDREQMIIDSYFGPEEKTLRQIAGELKISVSRTRQIMYFAMRKLRIMMVKKGFLLETKIDGDYGWKIVKLEKNKEI